MSSQTVLALGAFAVGVLTCAGCVFDDVREGKGFRQHTWQGDAAPHVMVADVQTNAPPPPDDGAPALVTIAYGTGGTWRLTSVCRHGGAMQPVRVRVDAGQATLVEGDAIQHIDGLELGPLPCTGTTRVTAFTTDAGTTISVEAAGAEDGSLFRFTQGGRLRGGYGGFLTNPLMLRPTER